MSKQYAKMLVGKTLDSGWKVTAQIPIGKDTTNGTGGFFSVAYLVEDSKGKKAFLKALDYSRAFEDTNPAKKLQELTEAYNFEVELLEKCKRRFFDRVVTSIEKGKIYIEENNEFSVVEFIIFELAEGDVRKFLDFSEAMDIVGRLQILHHVATGLKQLHSVGVSHQDLKPSNVLLFQNQSISKIADLGRSIDKTIIAPHEDCDIAGAPSYAPPEIIYGYYPPEWKERRLGCDFYHLGSLICFLFTSLTINALLTKHLPRSFKPFAWGGNWTGTYQEAIPYLRDAFDKVISEFETQIQNNELKKDLSAILRQLCEPDITLRGHPRERQINGNSFSLEKYITRFDLLAHRAKTGRYSK